MDATRFDTLARALAAPASRRLTGRLLAGLGITALTGIGVAPCVETAAKNKQKKKKTKSKSKKKTKSQPTPPQQCLDVQEACPTGNSEDCCAGLFCSTTTCDGDGSFCLQKEDGPCTSVCDCGGFLECSQRARNTCQSCLQPSFGECVDEDECCLSASICGDNGIAVVPVCCQPEGAACGDSEDCCVGFGCDQRGNFTCENCRREQESCTAEADECCRDDQICALNFCTGDPNQTVCCGQPQAFCSAPCDCCGPFNACDTNACGAHGCCRVEGGACASDCDCCAGRECDGVTCKLID